jgi:hypothetical protein
MRASLLGVKSYSGSSLSLAAGVTHVAGSTGGNAKLPPSRITRSMPTAATSRCKSAMISAAVRSRQPIPDDERHRRPLLPGERQELVRKLSHRSAV